MWSTHTIECPFCEESFTGTARTGAWAEGNAHKMLNKHIAAQHRVQSDACPKCGAQWYRDYPACVECGTRR